MRTTLSESDFSERPEPAPVLEPDFNKFFVYSFFVFAKICSNTLINEPTLLSTIFMPFIYINKIEIGYFLL
jgi:hypothetical protein